MQTQIIEQIDHDEKLLELMLSDISEVEDLYKPTNYWSHYSSGIIKEIYSKELTDFRNGISPFTSFGASDFSINDEIFSDENVIEYFHWLTKEKFERHSLDLNDCAANAYGNPQDLHQIDGYL